MAYVENGKTMKVGKEENFKNFLFLQLKKTKVNGSISSLVEINPIEYYIATESNEIYLLNIKSFLLKLLKTSHRMTVHSIVFPK